LPASQLKRTIKAAAYSDQTSSTSEDVARPLTEFDGKQAALLFQRSKVIGVEPASWLRTATVWSAILVAVGAFYYVAGATIVVATIGCAICGLALLLYALPADTIDL
jgi:hypothetical protein